MGMGKSVKTIAVTTHLCSPILFRKDSADHCLDDQQPAPSRRDTQSYFDSVHSGAVNPM